MIPSLSRQRVPVPQTKRQAIARELLHSSTLTPEAARHFAKPLPERLALYNNAQQAARVQSQAGRADELRGQKLTPAAIADTCRAMQPTCFGRHAMSLYGLYHHKLVQPGARVLQAGAGMMTWDSLRRSDPTGIIMRHGETMRRQHQLCAGGLSYETAELANIAGPNAHIDVLDLDTEVLTAVEESITKQYVIMRMGAALLAHSRLHPSLYTERPEAYEAYTQAYYSYLQGFLTDVMDHASLRTFGRSGDGPLGAPLIAGQCNPEMISRLRRYHADLHATRLRDQYDLVWGSTVLDYIDSTFRPALLARMINTLPVAGARDNTPYGGVVGVTTSHSAATTTAQVLSVLGVEQLFRVQAVFEPHRVVIVGHRAEQSTVLNESLAAQEAGGWLEDPLAVR